MLIGVNLRPAITGIAPLVDRMIGDGVAVGAIGMHTTLPLVLFGLASVFVGVVGNRIGFARALALGLVVLASGCFLRSWGLADGGSSLTLLGGPLLVGLGIAFGNVLLLGVVKSRYPNHLGVMTSLYSTAMNVEGALGIALAVPLADSLPGGWRASLGFGGMAALSPLLFWIPQIARKPVSRVDGNPLEPLARMAKDSRAWQVTVLMGLQSLLFYSSVAWLPVMLQKRGMSESASYAWPTVMQLCGCVASLTLPTLGGQAQIAENVGLRVRYRYGCKYLRNLVVPAGGSRGRNNRLGRRVERGVRHGLAFDSDAQQERERGRLLVCHGSDVWIPHCGAVPLVCRMVERGERKLACRVWFLDPARGRGRGSRILGGTAGLGEIRQLSNERWFGVIRSCF